MQPRTYSIVAGVAFLLVAVAVAGFLAFQGLSLAAVSRAHDESLPKPRRQGL